MDAFWQRKFFVREAGGALIHEFFIGGILLGVFATILFFLDSHFNQTDSQFGFTEAANERGERFGFDEVPRMLEWIHTENLSSNKIAHEVKHTVQKFSNYQLADDTTAICLKV